MRGTVNVPGVSAADLKKHSTKNHVPEIEEETNNARFLRNDNTWQDVTPENIGAQSEIKGVAGDFVVIGSDGKATTKAITYAEGVSF